MTQIDPALLAIAGAGLPGAPPPPRDGWHDHLDAVLDQGLAGLFAASASAGMVRIDSHMAGRLQEQLDAEAVRAVQLESELLRLAPALEHLGGVVLQGAVLAHAAYPDPLLRPFTDIDLLVPEERIEHAISILGTYGYQRARPEPAPGYDTRVGQAVVLRHPGGVVIDLHRTLASGMAGGCIDVHEIVAGRRHVPLGPHTVAAPSWEAHLVECTLHAVLGDGLARPLSLRDIAEVAHHPWLDAGATAELAFRWQVAELVGLGLRAARDGLGLELPDALARLAYHADELRNGERRRGASLALEVAGPNGNSRLLPALPGPDVGQPPSSEPPGSGRPLPVLSLQPAGAIGRPAFPSRQEAWSRARPARQRASPRSNGRSPSASGDGTGGHAQGNGHRQGADDDGAGPPGAPPDGSPTSGPGPGAGTSAPPRKGLAFGIAGAALLAVTAVGSRYGNNSLGLVFVPAAGLLLAVATSRRIARLRPDEAWVGRWLVLAVVAKLGASYYRYHTASTTYGGVADATGYDTYGRKLARAWLNGGHAPDLENLRETNFIRWFTGVVYYVFGTDMVTGFFVFGLLALVGSYFWYRATVDAVPRLDKRLYLALVLFAPSVAFWPSSIGKESLMQLGIGTVALATSLLLRHRLASAAVFALGGGWLLWVVRPHLLALATLAAGCAYAGGKVRGKGGAMRSMLARPVGLLAVVLMVAFAVSQATKFLGIEELSLSSIETELNENTERTSQGGSEFDHGGNSLNPLRLPQGAVTVLLRPFPWETDSSLQLVSSIESILLAGLVVARLRSVRAALTRARSTPFLMYCWILVILYAATFSSIANFGLLVRQRSLVLPALYAIIAVQATTKSARAPATPPRNLATGGVRVA